MALNNRNYRGAFASDLNGMLASREHRGYSASAYSRYARLFDRYCVENQIEPGPLTQEHFFGWIKNEEKYGRKMTKEKLCFFRGFGRYLLAIGKEAYIPHMTLCPKKSRSNITMLSDDQIAALFAEIDCFYLTKKNSFLAKETFPTMCRFCYACGLRPQEAHALLRKDINLITGEITIRDSKNRRDRIVVAAADMLKVLRKYDANLDTVFPAAEYLFVDSEGNQADKGQMRRWINACWIKINPQIPKNKLKGITLYSLRHQFATRKIYEWSQEGHDRIYQMIPYLRIYMGHVSIGDTLYYVHLMPELTSQIQNWNTSFAKLNLGERYDQ